MTQVTQGTEKIFYNKSPKKSRHTWSFMQKNLPLTANKSHNHSINYTTLENVIKTFVSYDKPY